MKNPRNNEKGFGLIETLLIVLIVFIVGFGGYYVFINQHKKSSAATNNTSAHKATNPTNANTSVPPDPTAKWTTYSSADGKMSLKYPTNWVTATNPDLCSSGILLLGANSTSVGKCASENFGQVSVTWQPSHAECGDLNGDAWVVSDKVNVTVSGVSGLKQLATAKSPGTGLGSVPEGTKTINYCFNTGGYTYVANYTQLSTYPDAQSDFNLMVTKTLKFTN